MWNRRRSNTWIAVELLLVFCLAWYIADYLFVYNYNLSIPNYRDTDHTLQVKLARLPETNPEYRAEESEGEAQVANYRRIVQMIGDYPGVEAVGVSFGGATPGSGNYWGAVMHASNDTVNEANGQRITFDPAYDFFRVFGYSTGGGQRPASVNDFDWGAANGIVIGRKVEQMIYPEGGSALGKEIVSWRNSDERFVVTGVVDDIKRFNYDRPQGAFYFASPLKADNVNNAEISIRHSASVSSRAFRDKFKAEMTDRLRVGNYYLLSVTSYAAIHEKTDREFGMTSNIRLRAYMMAFFLLNIMLCVMGTFWYRINQRPNEIGLRKAVGATTRSIHSLLVMEGVFLLLLIVVPAMIIEYQFVHAGLIETLGGNYSGIKDPAFLPDRTPERFLITNGITLLIMLLTVTVAIWLPARRGASLAAADALRYE
jgi:hypothetical protein